jgi:hypothetical protein
MVFLIACLTQNHMTESIHDRLFNNNANAWSFHAYSPDHDESTLASSMLSMAFVCLVFTVDCLFNKSANACHCPVHD